MSATAMLWAWQQECATSGEKLTLLAFAWEADEQGCTFCGPKRLKAKTGLQEAGLRKNIARLAEAGLMSRYRRKRKDGSEGSAFTVLAMPRDHALDLDAYEFIIGELIEGPPIPPPIPRDTPPSPAGDPPLSRGTPRTDQTPKQDSLLPSVGERDARANGKPVTYRGKRVTPECLQHAEDLLVVFNESTGRKLNARKADGTASEHLKQIIGALLDGVEDGVRMAHWAAAIRNTVKNPPEWVDGDVQLGHIFGPRARAHALSNTGKPRTRAAGTPGKVSAGELLREMNG